MLIFFLSTLVYLFLSWYAAPYFEDYGIEQWLMKSIILSLATFLIIWPIDWAIDKLEDKPKNRVNEVYRDESKNEENSESAPNFYSNLTNLTPETNSTIPPNTPISEGDRSKPYTPILKNPDTGEPVISMLDLQNLIQR